MSVAITFCGETKQKRREDKHNDLFFCRSQAKSLPRLIEFEAPVPLQFLACSFCRDRNSTEPGMTPNAPSLPKWRRDFSARRRREFEH